MSTDKTLAVCVAIQDCGVIDLWEGRFQSHYEKQSLEVRLRDYSDYDRMWRAALLFSLVSLRKISDFAEGRRLRKDDMVIGDFGLSVKSVIGETELIGSDLREEINKAILHLTEELDPSQSDLTRLREAIRLKAPLIRALGEKFFAMI